MPTNFDLRVRTKRALIDEAWCKRKVEWALKRSPKSTYAGHQCPAAGSSSPHPLQVR